MKKKTMLGVAAAAAAGAVGWYLTARGRNRQIEHLRREAKRLLSVRKDELEALRRAVEAGEPVPADAMGPVPLDRMEVDSLRFEDGAAVVVLRGEEGMAWVSSLPLDRLEQVYAVPWRGTARRGVLYTEYLGSGWYAGYALTRS